MINIDCNKSILFKDSVIFDIFKYYTIFDIFLNIAPSLIYFKTLHNLSYFLNISPSFIFFKHCTIFDVISGLTTPMIYHQCYTTKICQTVGVEVLFNVWLENQQENMMYIYIGKLSSEIFSNFCDVTQILSSCNQIYPNILIIWLQIYGFHQIDC